MCPTQTPLSRKRRPTKNLFRIYHYQVIQAAVTFFVDPLFGGHVHKHLKGHVFTHHPKKVTNSQNCQVVHLKIAPKQTKGNTLGGHLSPPTSCFGNLFGRLMKDTWKRSIQLSNIFWKRFSRQIYTIPIPIL